MYDYDGLYSSIFVTLGLGYNWNIDQLSDFYGVPPGQFELWLKSMGFPKDEIERIRKRKPFGKGFCHFCGIKSNETFCSSDCDSKYYTTRNTLRAYRRNGLIPLRVDGKYRSANYIIATGRVKYDKR